MSRRLSLCSRSLALFLLTLGLALPSWADRPAAGAPSTFADKQAAWERHQELDQASQFHGLPWRNIGPVVQGGRIVDVESVPGEPYTFYVAYASAGVWRTTDNGVNFEPIFDDQPRLIMGDLAIDPQQPKNIWVGTGENNSSRSSYGGWGVFRSTDGGESWEQRGLGESDRIGRILVDPRDSNRVYVAASGKLYTPGGQRGVFRTLDGGESWEQVLDPGQGYVGAIDMVQNPKNPDLLYVSMWERSRTAWNFVEGGNGSAIYRSKDGGATWKRLDGGFPQGEFVGRIGLAISPSNPNILYASLDNQEQLPEEEWDLGSSAVTPKRLRKMSKEEFLQQDPAAIDAFVRGNDLDTELTGAILIEKIESDELTIQDILAELDDANSNLFNTDIRGLEVYRSDDGGDSWRKTHDEPIRGVTYTYGYYFGQIRVAPDDPDRIFCMGVPAIKSEDGGKSFSGMNGRRVHVDHHELWIDPNYPERMIIGNDGGLDVSYDGGKSWLKMDRQPVGQFYTVHVDMEKPYNVYGGLQDNGTLKGSSKSRPGLDEWNVIGGGDGMYVQTDSRDGTTYVGYQFGNYRRQGGREGGGTVRPRDKIGDPALRYNWATPILLSKHNEDILYFGANMLYRSMDQGVTWEAISDDLTRSTERGDVPFATISTLAESPKRFGQLWVGTDDGQVWVTDDGGTEWRDVAGQLPRDRWVSRVEASHHARERAYVSLNGYRNDDLRAYVYMTDDLGRSWKSISSGLPGESVNVIREDPVNPDVLYVGTDRGVYVSLDRGNAWQGLPNGLPNVPVHDLVIHPRERELVVGTHGRSIYILDALPIQESDSDLMKEALHVFPVESTRYRRGWQGRRSEWFYRAEDQDTLKVPFWSSDAGTATLNVRDKDDRILRSMELDVSRGVNQFEWDYLLNKEQALAAERESLEAAAKKAAKPSEAKGKKKKSGKAEASDKKKGSLAKQPPSRSGTSRLGDVRHTGYLYARSIDGRRKQLNRVRSGSTAQIHSTCEG